MNISYTKKEYCLKDLTFLLEIQRDLKLSGFQAGCKADTMIRDWLHELEELMSIFSKRNFLKSRHRIRINRIK